MNCDSKLTTVGAYCRVVSGRIPVLLFNSKLFLFDCQEKIVKQQITTCLWWWLDSFCVKYRCITNTHTRHTLTNHFFLRILYKRLKREKVGENPSSVWRVLGVLGKTNTRSEKTDNGNLTEMKMRIALLIAALKMRNFSNDSVQMRRPTIRP